jgi:hypothetical protein
MFSFWKKETLLSIGTKLNKQNFFFFFFTLVGYRHIFTKFEIYEWIFALKVAVFLDIN